MNTRKTTCDTIGCDSRPTHVLTSTLRTPRGWRVCLPCGESYLNRPSLRATLEPFVSLVKPPRDAYEQAADDAYEAELVRVALYHTTD